MLKYMEALGTGESLRIANMFLPLKVSVLFVDYKMSVLSEHLSEALI